MRVDTLLTFFSLHINKTSGIGSLGEPVNCDSRNLGKALLCVREIVTAIRQI